MNRSVWGVHDFVYNYHAVNPQEMIAGIVPGDAATWMQGSSGPSGCGWYRVVVPLAELGRHGWATAWRAGAPPAASDGFRVITAQRLDKPGVLATWRRLRLTHRLVYETDDNIFEVPEERWRLASYPRPVMQDTVTCAAQTSDLVTVSTEPLGEVYRGLGCEVRVLPNCLPPGVTELQRLRHHRKLVVGWAGGGTHGPDLAMIAGPLRDFFDSMPRKKAELHLVGCDFTREMGLPARCTEWVAADESLAYYKAFDFDIGLAPMRGTVFDQSKSNIKALECMALGIPVLASDVDPYRGTVIDGVNGYLCATGADWSKRLRELANDAAAREELGAAGREQARASNITACWQRWADVYEELL